MEIRTGSRIRWGSGREGRGLGNAAEANDEVRLRHETERKHFEVRSATQ